MELNIEWTILSYTLVLLWAKGIVVGSACSPSSPLLPLGKKTMRSNETIVSSLKEGTTIKYKERLVSVGLYWLLDICFYETNMYR